MNNGAVIDTSALITILRRESCWEYYLRFVVENAGSIFINSITLVETKIVAECKSLNGGRFVQEFILLHNIIVEPFETFYSSIAFEGFCIFGQGRHPAGLNFGDCAVYAHAKAKKLPILCKGNDFSKTDITTIQYAN